MCVVVESIVIVCGGYMCVVESIWVYNGDCMWFLYLFDGDSSWLWRVYAWMWMWIYVCGCGEYIMVIVCGYCICLTVIVYRYCICLMVIQAGCGEYMGIYGDSSWLWRGYIW